MWLVGFFIFDTFLVANFTISVLILFWLQPRLSSKAEGLLPVNAHKSTFMNEIAE